MLYSKFSINKVEWLDLVFENRNQSYGAYVLRKESGNYLMKALIISSVFFIGMLLVLFSSFWLKDSLMGKINSKEHISDPILKLTEVSFNKKEQPPLAVSKSAPKVKQTQSLPPRVVNDAFVKTDPPTTEKLMNTIIGPSTTEGTTSIDANVLPGTNQTGDGNGFGEENNELLNVASVDQMPEFPGGMQAWSKFLNRNLSYPTLAQQNDITGRVIVSFVVEKNGEISNLKILQGIGAGCDEEALRVIKKSPLWKPGLQNGKAVRVSYVIPIVFRMN
ncbi:energy transducer TonB [Pedobacter cryophilus]|uniref:Energy transducer TonB n=1 Tax=Pedobacter cryophilus TaxID=2571271 RepID=A0A4U1BUM4_9SPHI|nr:energy transducer TonB [Pedobacter cryophilus]TKB96068.1 energy transducer TonB [Pedobacter cryophilus]